MTDPRDTVRLKEAQREIPIQNAKVIFRIVIVFYCIIAIVFLLMGGARG